MDTTMLSASWFYYQCRVRRIIIIGLYSNDLPCHYIISKESIELHSPLISP